MQNLINELEQPSSDSSGNVTKPSMVKQRAANLIKQLATVAEQDRVGRLQIQNLYEQHITQADMDNVALRLAQARIKHLEFLVEPLDVSLYNEAINKELE